jgi:hypothetical protein
MPTSSNSTAVEGFILDEAFLDKRKAFNGILLGDATAIGTLTQNTLSFFNQPTTIDDTRSPSSRDVNWAPNTAPSVVIDSEVFGSFIDVVNALPQNIASKFFELIDRAAFRYSSSIPVSTVETYLNTDTDTHAIYVPGTLELSTRIVTDTVYLQSNTTMSVSIPDFIRFSVILPSGSTTRQFDITLFTESSAFKAGYSSTTVLKVVPPTSYQNLLSGSLLAENSNALSVAGQSGGLIYDNTNAAFVLDQPTGTAEFTVVLIDSAQHRLTVPFQILYKGRVPGMVEARAAIKAAVLGSGVGTEAAWRLRIPGLFIEGRFYIIPMWNETFTKPGQTVFQNILNVPKVIDNTKDVMASKAWTNVGDYIEIMPVSFDRMISTIVPELSGITGISSAATLFPDYQAFSPTEANFQYMLADTQAFSTHLNAILALDFAETTSSAYQKSTESLFEFFGFVVGAYEFCVITKDCYTRLKGSAT